MIRLGIVGCNYGRAVLLPAFRADSRCRVVALAGSDAARTAELARQSDIPEAFGDWARMIERPISMRSRSRCRRGCSPRSRSRRSRAASRCSWKSRWPPTSPARPRCCKQAGALPAMIDFTFTEITAWQKAKALLDSGAIGRLRHVDVLWNVENASTRLRLKNWKTSGEAGGGALGNLASHSLHYFEWFCGPLDRPFGAAVRPAGRSGVRNRRDAEPRLPVRRSGQPDHELRLVSRQRPSSRVLRRRRHAAAGQSDHRLHARLRS